MGGTQDSQSNLEKELSKLLANKHIKRCSASLAIRKMQIKTIVRYQIRPNEIVITKKTDDKYCQGCGETGIPVYCWRRGAVLWLLWRTVAAAQSVKHEVVIQTGGYPAVPLLGVYWREMKTCAHENSYTDDHSSIFPNSPKWKKHKCPSTDEWINKCSTFMLWSIIQQ